MFRFFVFGIKNGSAFSIRISLLQRTLWNNCFNCKTGNTSFKLVSVAVHCGHSSDRTNISQCMCRHQAYRHRQSVPQPPESESWPWNALRGILIRAIGSLKLTHSLLTLRSLQNDCMYGFILSSQSLFLSGKHSGIYARYFCLSWGVEVTSGFFWFLRWAGQKATGILLGTEACFIWVWNARSETRREWILR